MTLPVETGVVEALRGLDDYLANQLADTATEEGRQIIREWIAALARYEALGSSPDGDTHRAADGAVVAHSTYMSAVAGRMAFRDAFRRCLPVVRAAEALAAKWTTNGQRVDSEDFYAAINDVWEAVAKRNGDPLAKDDAAYAETARQQAAVSPDTQAGIANGDEPKTPAGDTVTVPRERVRRLYRFLSALCDGAPLSVPGSRFLMTDNPAFTEDNGEDPRVLIDVQDWMLAAAPTTPAGKVGE